MKPKHQKALKTAIDQLLENFDKDGGNPEWCYETLASDMAKAAALVYDGCMQGQEFAKRNR